MPRAPKKCGSAHCDNRVSGRTYCPQCEAVAQKRANTASRGYDHNHRAASEAARRKMVDGTPCGRCGKPMFRRQRLELDHTDDRAGYRGLAHALCNSRAGGKKRTQAGNPPPAVR